MQENIYSKLSEEKSKENLKKELGCAVGNLSHTLLLLNILENWFISYILDSNLNNTISFAVLYSNYEGFSKNKYPSTDLISKNSFFNFLKYVCNKHSIYFNRVRIKGVIKYQFYENDFLAKKLV